MAPEPKSAIRSHVAVEAQLCEPLCKGFRYGLGLANCAQPHRDAFVLLPLYFEHIRFMSRDPGRSIFAPVRLLEEQTRVPQPKTGPRTRYGIYLGPYMYGGCRVGGEDRFCMALSQLGCLLP